MFWAVASFLGRGVSTCDATSEADSRRSISADPDLVLHSAKRTGNALHHRRRGSSVVNIWSLKIPAGDAPNTLYTERKLEQQVA